MKTIVNWRGKVLTRVEVKEVMQVLDSLFEVDIE
jgi:hypothetical protein